MRICPVVARLLPVLILGSAVCAQDMIPRPYAFIGGEGMGGGYAPFAAIGGGGFRIDSDRLVVDAQAWYDNGHKVNDNDQPNPSGHDRGLVSAAYYRLPSGWTFGAGARWSELSTTNYKKSSWEPTFGGSWDYLSDPRCRAERCVGAFSMQVRADYMLKGSDWTNGTQGPLLTVYFPSPSVKAHILFRESLGVYRFYETVTDRTNALLTSEQMSVHGWDSFAQFTIMWRF
jgi:hypothetical protein